MKQFRRRWRANLNRFVYRGMPTVSRMLVTLSTFEARAKLKRTPGVRVLVDNTVLSHAITHETAWISTGAKQWGPHTIDTGYSARIPVFSIEGKSEEHENIRYLPGIAMLAEQGHIEFFSSGELQIERLRQPGGRYSGYSYFDYNALAAVPIEDIDQGPPFVVSGSSSSGVSADDQRQRLNLINDSRYRQLVRLLGTKNSQDAWHIRTAEIHGLYCFLTMDFSLLRTLESQKGNELVRSLQTRVISPGDFGRHFRIKPVPTQIISYDGASFPVRPDLHWPDGKRRPRSDYRTPDS